MSLSWQMAALLLLGGSTVLLFLGMPVALSFVAINIVGAWLFLGGEAGLLQVVRNSVVSVMNFSLTPIPLFILMGELLFHTGLALKVIEGVERSDPAGAGPPRRHCRRGRHGVFRHLGLNHRHHGHAGLA